MYVTTTVWYVVTTILLTNKRKSLIVTDDCFSKGLTTRRRQRRWWRSISNSNSSNRRGEILRLDLFIFFLFLSVKGEKNQINNIKSMWEEIKDGVCPAKQRCKCYFFYSFSRINFTPTPINKEAFNGQRHTNTYVSISMVGLSCSLHIQFFLQNQSLLSPIEN